MDVDDIMQKQVEQLEKEKKELGERLRNQEKKVGQCLAVFVCLCLCLTVSVSLFVGKCLLLPPLDVW